MPKVFLEQMQQSIPGIDISSCQKGLNNKDNIPIVTAVIWHINTGDFTSYSFLT